MGSSSIDLSFPVRPRGRPHERFAPTRLQEPVMQAMSIISLNASRPHRLECVRVRNKRPGTCLSDDPCRQCPPGACRGIRCLVAIGFLRALIVSARPTAEKCRPFDAARTGLSLGEGAAVFCLEKGDSDLVHHRIW